MLQQKDLNAYLSTFLDDKDIFNLASVSKEQNKNFNDESIWKNKLKELKLCQEPFSYMREYIKTEYIQNVNTYDRVCVRLQPFFDLEKRLQDAINKYDNVDTLDFKSTYLRLKRFNDLSTLIYGFGDVSFENRCKASKEILDLVQSVSNSSYEKFYYTQVLTPIIFNHYSRKMNRGMFCSTGMSEESRNNMRNNNMLQNLYFSRLKDFIHVSIDKIYEDYRKELIELRGNYLKVGNIVKADYLAENMENMIKHKKDSIEGLHYSSSLIPSAKELFEQYKKENNLYEMIQLYNNKENHFIF